MTRKREEARRKIEADVASLSGKELREKLVELEFLFELYWEADRRAIKMWQEAHPGRSLTWPDRANMVVWLLDRLDEEMSKQTLASRH